MAAAAAAAAVVRGTGEDFWEGGTGKGRRNPEGRKEVPSPPLTGGLFTTRVLAELSA